MQASPVAMSLVAVHENSPGFSTKANLFVKKSSQAHKEQAEKAMPTAQNDGMGSEDGSMVSETLERSKTSGCKSPNTRHARCVRTKESEPLTEETNSLSVRLGESSRMPSQMRKTDTV